MKLLILAHDIPDNKAHLMPWRTVCEITEGLCAMGHDTRLVSLDSFNGPLAGEYLPDNSMAIRKQRQHLAMDLLALEKTDQPDVIFWPVSWRDPSFRTQALDQLSAKIVGWFPGGDYTKSSAFYALRCLGIKKAMPYIREAWAPRKKQVKRWKKYNIRQLIAMTCYTARGAVTEGYRQEDVFSIPPGREDIEKEPVR